MLHRLRQPVHRLVALTGVCVLTLALGCAGPMRLSRGLDEQYNRSYVESPLITEALLPLYLLGDLGAKAIDLVLLNPVTWWKHALEGRGRPYIYENPPAETE